MRSRLLASLPVACALAVGACGGEQAGTTAEKPSGGAPTTTATAKAAKATRPRIDLGASHAFIAKRSSVPILCYHQIRPQTAADSAVDRQYIMPPKVFRSELAALDRGGYHTISPDQLVAHLTTGAKLPAKPVMLTFDDAVDDQMRIAVPELRRRHMTATFFIMTVVLGNSGYMTKGQVRRLDRDGMTVAAHTWDHHRVDQYAGDDWRVQIDQPVRELRKIVGHRIRYFAYPYGVWAPNGFAHLRHAGLQAAFQLTDKYISLSDPLMTIRRKIADPSWTTSEFEQALRGGFRKVAA